MQSIKNKKYSGLNVLKKIEKNLYFFNKSIVLMLSKKLGTKKVILDFGAGIGTLAQIWFSENGIKPECLEIDPALGKILIERDFICYRSIKSLNKKYEVIYSSNVIEHIKDDLETLIELNSKLQNNGFLCLFVPAFNSLYSELDKSVGHYRRYSKKDIITKLKSAKFDIIDCYYVDSIGFLVWWLYIKLFKFKLDNDNSSNTLLAFYDKYIFPVSTFLDSLGFKFLLGKNLIAIARKIEHS